MCVCVCVCVCERILGTRSKYRLRRPVTSNIMSPNCHSENEENLTIIRRKSKHSKRIILFEVVKPRTVI